MAKCFQDIMMVVVSHTRGMGVVRVFDLNQVAENMKGLNKI
jgi:hypothetical protein